jgi:hypothetical protein
VQVLENPWQGSAAPPFCNAALQYKTSERARQPFKMLPPAETILGASATLLMHISGIDDAIWRRSPAPTHAGDA